MQTPDTKSDIEIKPIDLIPLYGLIRCGERNENRDLLFGSFYNLATSVAFSTYQLLTLPVLYNGLELIIDN